MGETRAQRVGLLLALATLPAHPDSVPINKLVQVAGTPLHGSAELDPFEFVRMIAVARIAMPRAMVRLSAGREAMSDELQALCFLAGANSIFYGDKLLTTGNPESERDWLCSRGWGCSRWPCRWMPKATTTAAPCTPISAPMHPAAAALTRPETGRKQAPRQRATLAAPSTHSATMARPDLTARLHAQRALRDAQGRRRPRRTVTRRDGVRRKWTASG